MTQSKLEQLCADLARVAKKVGLPLEDLPRSVWRNHKHIQIDPKRFGGWPYVRACAAQWVRGESVTEGAPLQDDTVTDPVEEHVLKSQVRNLSRSRKDLLERVAITEARYELLSGLVKQTDRPTPVHRREKTSAVHEGTAVLVCSDWHVEETVDPNEVNGLNEYNLQIAEARARRLADGFLWLYDLHRTKKFQIRDVVVGLLGDLITGWIHPELMVTNAFAPAPALIFLEDLVRMLLRAIFDNTDATVHLVCVAGNHGRLSAKEKPIKKKTLTSLEWVVYANIVRWCRDNYPDRIVPHIGLGSMVYLDVYDYTLRFIHGDQVGYSGGIGGVTIPLNKRLLRWNSKHNAHCTYLGHFHTYKPEARFQVNGSLIGYSEYANWIAGEWEPPIQSLNIIDSRYGRTGVWPIFCSEQAISGTDPREPTVEEKEVQRQLQGRRL